MAKKIKQQAEQKGNKVEVAKEITPTNDQEVGAEFPYQSPEKGMTKKQNQQKKES